MNPKSFYITTTLPYVNSDPHIGFAMEIIRADAIARYKKLQGFEVFFNTGTDEHGQKLLRDAEKAGIPVKAYVDGYAEKFHGLVSLLGISDDVHFIRTTDAHHEAAAQELWRRCDAKGYIYKGAYKAKYCVGCELEKTDSELNDVGRCPIHPDKEIEIIDEENYFFAYSKLEEKLRDLYTKNSGLVIPEFRFNEMKAFLDRGLQDFSISRQKSKMSWGVPVPGDEDHVMYVWFDALTNYISTLGWPDDTKQFNKFWKEGTPVQYCGKDNTRQQSMMWQAMLLAAELPTTEHVVVNGFINSGGQKMSKSLGNVINPYDIVKEYESVAGDLASDVIRYYLLRHVNSFEDSDVTGESIREAYNAHLANGIGNLVSRIMTLSEKYCEPMPTGSMNLTLADDKDFLSMKKNMDNFDIQATMNNLWLWNIDGLERFMSLNENINSFETSVLVLDRIISEKEPFKMVKGSNLEQEQGKELIRILRFFLYKLSCELEPFMPKTSKEIKKLILENKKPEKPLFMRLG